LRQQLQALQKCISSQEGEQAKITAEIAARKARADALDQLIKGFDGIVDDYKTKRHQLTSREDALKGFYRDTGRVFQDRYRFPESCLQELQTAINSELCELEKAKCCQKNLEGKLGTDTAGKVTRFTRIIWEQQQAAKQLEKANRAFANLKAFGTWVDDQFKPLETLKEQIATLLNSLDPQDHNVAFYKFYWHFVPTLCKRFPVAICCKDGDGGGPAQYPPPGEPPSQYPPPGQPPGQYPPQGQYPPPGQPPGQYPPQGQYPPPGQPPGQYPPQGQYPPPGQPPAQYPPQGQPPAQHPPQGQYPPQGQPPTQYPPQGQYPSQGPAPAPTPAQYGPGPQQYPGGQPPPQGYGSPQYPSPGQTPEQYPPHGQHPPHPPEHIGCEPGDWHPSEVTVEQLKQLICCAWDYVRTKEEQLAEKNEAVARATRNLALIKAKVDADGGSLDTRIVTRVKKVKCTRCASSR
jgi:hypothetical protein